MVSKVSIAEIFFSSSSDELGESSGSASPASPEWDDQRVRGDRRRVFPSLE